MRGFLQTNIIIFILFLTSFEKSFYSIAFSSLQSYHTVISKYKSTSTQPQLQSPIVIPSSIPIHPMITSTNKYPILLAYPQSNHHRYRHHHFALHAINPNFNPFQSRRKNSRQRWFESDLESFYLFVESQGLLTPEQEKKYGKALRMNSQIEKIRQKLSMESVASATSTTDPITSVTSTTITTGKEISNEELALHLGCSVLTLEKIAKYAEVSKLKLINGNMKLVLAIVSRYRLPTITNAELIAEGVRGLSKAVLRFDYTKGFRFATYATWYVHQAVADYVRIRRHPTKMPSRYLLLLRRVKQFSSDYKVTNSRLPTVNEISSALKASHFDVTKVLTMQIYPTLLTAPILKNSGSGSKDMKDRTVEDTLVSEFTSPPLHSSSKHLRSTLEHMMEANLNDVERDVLRLRLGLDDGVERAVKEVGKQFKISWKQVRSVEKNALSKLSSSEEMPDFYRSYYALV